MSVCTVVLGGTRDCIYHYYIMLRHGKEWLITNKSSTENLIPTSQVAADKIERKEERVVVTVDKDCTN